MTMQQTHDPVAKPKQRKCICIQRVRGKTLMRGMELSDSVCFDFHKGMGLPLATSLLVVKERDDLITGFQSSDTPDYLGSAADPSKRYFLGSELEFDHDLVAFTDCSPELSRAAKGVKVWWMIKLHGLEAWAAHYDHLLDCAASARAKLAQIPGLVLGPSGLNIVTFHVQSDDDDVARTNARTNNLVDDLTARRKVLLSQASYVESKSGETYSLARACLQNVATTQATVDLLVGEVKAVVDAGVSRPGP
ncbi:Aste57867_15559 [Aphanomyces stellatus]|uniref:Aste57867_15559 protein n=1 Tax=Aphanomyces stellatus TaxID=120398 RepID=A0A485L3P4_9STRA|nr:hypothetical protein As57867_015503 [Aphanomyces stellatus]VFT92361.1 Aste57867_15559 [Aphanomyces stellatus]